MPLLLVGVGHVFRIEEPLAALIQRERPAVVALELDPARYQGLLQRAAGRLDAASAARRASRPYRMLARFQDEVAASLGTQVGSEMLAAARAAEAAGSRLALVDRPAEATVERLWSEMRFGEKARLLLSSLAARLRLGRRANLEQEIERYQRDPEAYLRELGKGYPTLKRVLLDERNEHMARELRALAAADRSVLAVVGDGHVDGLLAHLRDLDPRVVRLAELRAAAARGPALRLDAAGARVAFSFDATSPEGALRRAP